METSYEPEHDHLLVGAWRLAAVRPFDRRRGRQRAGVRASAAAQPLDALSRVLAPGAHQAPRSLVGSQGTERAPCRRGALAVHAAARPVDRPVDLPGAGVFTQPLA